MKGRRLEQWPLVAAVGMLLLSGGALLYYVLFQRPEAAPEGRSGAVGAGAGRGPVMTLSSLAPEPGWGRLERLADVLTAAEVRESMTRIYGDGTADWEEWLKVGDERAGGAGEVEIVKWSAEAGGERLALSMAGGREPVRYWREAEDLPVSSDPDGRPLEGVKVVLDPGHIGGAWARMEERWYQPQDEPTAVMEGEMTLLTAQRLKPALEALGAVVSLVREQAEPVTTARPGDYERTAATTREAELFFYRRAEIRARADLVNERLQPDVLVCLHFNAEPWGDPGRVTFVESNHLHVIVNGHYAAGEMAMDDVRYEMLERVLQRSDREELRLADAVSKALAAATGLADEVHRAVATESGDLSGIEPVERHVASEVDVHLAELRRSADVDEHEFPAVAAEIGERRRGNRGNHGKSSVRGGNRTMDRFIVIQRYVTDGFKGKEWVDRPRYADTPLRRGFFAPNRSSMQAIMFARCGSATV